MRTETILLDVERAVSLTAYLQGVEGEFDFRKRPAMLVLPGGGYTMCSDREADPVAMAYLKAGYQVFILRYTVTAKGKWPYPLQDYEQAMSLLIENAESWHLDPEKIAVVGFSAGGHLAACAATMAEHKPKAAVLVYPAILKDIVDLCQPGMPYPHEHVDPHTCPCFIAAARDDKTVSIKNSLMFELALAEKGVAFESHIYSYGGHGFSTGEEWILMSSVCPRLPNWVSESVEWLGETLGRLTPQGFTEPENKGSMNANYAPVLSVECSISHLGKQSDAVKAVLQPMYAAIEVAAKARGFSVEGLTFAIGSNTAREIMETVHVPEETIRQIDVMLHGMINEV